MDDALRDRVAAMAARAGTALIADETMGELWLDGDIRQPFAVHGPTILLGSVGKTIWGGLRVGWIRADRTMIQRFVRERHSNDLGTPILDQLIVAKLMEDYDAILDERRALLRRRPTVTSWRRLLETARTEYERGAGILPLDEEEVYENYLAVG
jgi:DNA-binding transcriptional MocR family regulator